jgi:hypothetical protein
MDSFKYSWIDVKTINNPRERLIVVKRVDDSIYKVIKYLRTYPHETWSLSETQVLSESKYLSIYSN